MGLRTKQSIFAKNIGLLIEFAFSNDIELTFGEATRTNDQQELYYYGKTVHIDDGELELINGKRRTRTMNSKHLIRLAVDFNFFINNKLTYDKNKTQILGNYWESLHHDNKWGGNFNSFIDTPHFQMS